MFVVLTVLSQSVLYIALFDELYAVVIWPLNVIKINARNGTMPSVSSLTHSFLGLLRFCAFVTLFINMKHEGRQNRGNRQ